MGIDHRQEGGTGQVTAAPRSDRLDAAGRLLAAAAGVPLLAVALLIGLSIWNGSRSLPTAMVRCLAATELVLAPSGTRARHPVLIHPGVDLRHAPYLPPQPGELLGPVPRRADRSRRP